MKKVIALVLATGMFLSAQVAMAGSSNGLVITDKFTNESYAVDQAKAVVKQIEAGTHKAVVGAAANRCQNIKRVKYDATRFTVNPVWVANGEGFQKEYQAQVNYNFSCNMKVAINGSRY